MLMVISCQIVVLYLPQRLLHGLTWRRQPKTLRATSAQVRVGKAEAPTLLQRLTNMSLTWAEVQATFPAQQTADAAE